MDSSCRAWKESPLFFGDVNKTESIMEEFARSEHEMEEEVSKMFFVGSCDNVEVKAGPVDEGTDGMVGMEISRESAASNSGEA